MYYILCCMLALPKLAHVPMESLAYMLISMLIPKYCMLKIDVGDVCLSCHLKMKTEHVTHNMCI